MDHPWVEEAFRLELDGETDKAIDLIYVNMDNLMLEAKFDEVSGILNSIDCDGASEDLLVAFACITNTAKKLVGSRDYFISRIKTSLEKRGLEADEIEGIMEGL